MPSAPVDPGEPVEPVGPDSSDSADTDANSDDPAVAAPTPALKRARRLGGPSVPNPPPPPPGSRRSGRPVRPASPAVEPDEPQPAAEPEPPKSRAGRDLPAAIGVGVGLGAIIVISLFAYRPSFAIIVGVAVLYGCYELAKALRPAGIRVALTPLLVGGAATLVAAWLRGTNGLATAALVSVVVIAAWRLGDGARGYRRDTGATAFALLYLPTLGAFAVLLVHPSDGAGRVLAFIATVVCSDTGGYATGVLFGKHPLAPIVSKGKTWEGFAGSVIACSAAGILFLTLCFHHAWWTGLLYGLAIVVTATVGDLGASMIKRDVGIKDFGTLLPGHGGVMDRLDSLLPCAAVAYLVLSAVGSG